MVDLEERLTEAHCRALYQSLMRRKGSTIQLNPTEAREFAAAVYTAIQLYREADHA